MMKKISGETEMITNRSKVIVCHIKRIMETHSRIKDTDVTLCIC